MVLNLAEIIDGEGVQNHQIFTMDVVDLVAGIAWNKQHSSRLHSVHHTLNGDRSVARQGEIGLRLRVAMRLQRLAGTQTNHAHRHIVVASRSASEQLFPLRCAARGNLFRWPARPFQVIEVFGGYLHGRLASWGWLHSRMWTLVEKPGADTVYSLLKNLSMAL